VAVQPALVVNAARRSAIEVLVAPQPQVPLVLGGLVIPLPAVAPPPQPVAPRTSAAATAAASTRRAIRRICTAGETSAPGRAVPNQTWPRHRVDWALPAPRPSVVDFGHPQEAGGQRSAGRPFSHVQSLHPGKHRPDLLFPHVHRLSI